MANMSYCRMENTYGDLRDCYENWGDDDGDELSDSEKRYRSDLLELCKEIIRDYGEEDE